MKKQDTPSFEKKENPLSAEEMDILRSRTKNIGDRSKIPPPEKKNQSKAVKLARKNKSAAMVISVIAVAFVLVVALLAVYLSESLGLNSKKNYTFTFGKEQVKEKYEDIVINDVLYVDMAKLASFSDMSVSGGADTRKYLVSEDHYLKFTNADEYAVINGAKVVIESPAIINTEKCLVPYQFISKAVSTGLSFKHDQRKNSVEIKRTTYTVDDKEFKEDITFSHEKFQIAQAIQSTVGVKYEYNTDVSNFLAYIDPEDATPYLLLVNPENPLDGSFVPENMSAIPSKYTGKETYMLVGCAERALTAMMQAMYADGISAVYVTSAYRSYTYQYNLFEGYVKNKISVGMSREAAEAEVLKTSARPGTSEHQSGLCVDFMTTSMTTLNNEDFERSRAFEWLSQNAYKYGYILRYPEEKKAEVFYDYESWHFRFVGREAATEIYFSGLCLEEYLALI